MHVSFYPEFISNRKCMPNDADVVVLVSDDDGRCMRNHMNNKT